MYWNCDKLYFFTVSKNDWFLFYLVLLYIVACQSKGVKLDKLKFRLRKTNWLCFSTSQY